MTKTCLKLRHFNLPERFGDVLKRLADTKGEVCSGGEGRAFLPYSGPFADLNVDDYLLLQSEFHSKGLVMAMHTPTQVRFAKEGITHYISDPQKRRSLIEEIDNNSRFFNVDHLAYYWDESFSFSKWRSDDTLILSALKDGVDHGNCGMDQDSWFQSFAQYLGLTDVQQESTDRIFHYNMEGALADFMMLNRQHPAESAIHLLSEFQNLGRSSRFDISSSFLSLSRDGVSDADILVLYSRMHSFDESYLEPVFLELSRLGIVDPIGYIRELDNLKPFLDVVDAMRDNGYSDDEIRWVVGHYPLINTITSTGSYVLVNDLHYVFSRARKEGVSFQEIRWLLEDATGFARELNMQDVRINDVFKAYIHQAKRGHEAIYGLYQNWQKTVAWSFEANDATMDRPMRRLPVSEEFAKRMGIDVSFAKMVLNSTSPVLWEFVFKHRGEAYIFNPDKIEDYKAIAKDLHNSGLDLDLFFSHVSFDDHALTSPPTSLIAAAQMLQLLESVNAAMGSRYVEQVVLPKWQGFTKGYGAWRNSKTQRVDVTRHNIKDVNALLALFSHFPYSDNSVPKGDLKSPENLDVAREGRWFASQLDVEEIDARNMPAETYADYHELIKRLQDANSVSSSRYLMKQMLDLDAKKIFGEVLTDIKKIEEIRIRSNESYPHLGDRLVDNLGLAMLEKVTPTVFNVGELLRIAKLWDVKNNDAVFHDNQGLYQQYAYFVFQMISDIVMEKTDNWRDKDRIENLRSFLKDQKISLDDLVVELNAQGFPIMSESDWEKFKNRLTTGPGYVIRRGIQKTLPNSWQTTNLSGLSAAPATDWTPRHGVAVQVISNAKGTEIARAIQCDRAVMGAEVLLNTHALVDTEARKLQLGAAYVFSAPLNMTTPDNRTMTEIAYKDGEPMNWLMSAHGKDGLLLVDQRHSPKILDKRAILLGQMIEESDLKTPAIKNVLEVWLRHRKMENVSGRAVLDLTFQPFKRIEDKVLFRELMSIKKYSLLSGMLFTADSSSHHLASENGSASRRLFAEFAGGRFGVVDGTEYLTTEEAFEAAKAAGATKAIYMDTGFWDRADYVDGKGGVHRLDPGHSNSSASTNRVVIRVK